MTENRVYAATLEQYAELCAHFQKLGLAFTGQVTGDSTYFIDIKGY